MPPAWCHFCPLLIGCLLTKCNPKTAQRCPCRVPCPGAALAEGTPLQQFLICSLQLPRAPVLCWEHKGRRRHKWLAKGCCDIRCEVPSNPKHSLVLGKPREELGDGQRLSHGTVAALVPRGCCCVVCPAAGSPRSSQPFQARCKLISQLGQACSDASGERSLDGAICHSALCSWQPLAPPLRRLVGGQV